MLQLAHSGTLCLVCMSVEAGRARQRQHLAGKQGQEEQGLQEVANATGLAAVMAEASAA